MIMCTRIEWSVNLKAVQCVQSIWICKAALLLNDSHYFVFAVIFIVWHIINNIYWVNLHFLDVYRLQWMREWEREGECWWRPVRNKTCDEKHKLPLTHILTEFVLFHWPAAATAVVGWTHSTKWNFEWKNFPKPNSSHAVAINRQPHWDGRTIELQVASIVTIIFWRSSLVCWRLRSIATSHMSVRLKDTQARIHTDNPTTLFRK